MIEFLHTFTADHAVEGSRWFDDFTVKTEILKVDVSVIT